MSAPNSHSAAEKRLIAAAMNMAKPWLLDNRVASLRGNKGTLAKLIRACCRLNKLRSRK